VSQYAGRVSRSGTHLGVWITPHGVPGARTRQTPGRNRDHRESRVSQLMVRGMVAWSSGTVERDPHASCLTPVLSRRGVARLARLHEGDAQASGGLSVQAATANGGSRSSLRTGWYPAARRRSSKWSITTV